MIATDNGGAPKDNGALLAIAAFIAALPLARYGNAGLWSAFLLFVVARAIALGLHFRGCFRFDEARADDTPAR